MGLRTNESDREEPEGREGREGGEGARKKRRQMKRGEREREADGWSNRKVSRVGLAYYEYNDRVRMKLKLT